MSYLRDTKQLMEHEAAMLAPYAVHSKDYAGREHSEPEAVSRSPFQRDWHRITHSQGFRKLEFKTQVFVYGEGGEHGDVIRNRLTHTLEVSQIATSLARSLGLNEDLASAIALAHDLGHTPFGHSGEEELKALVPGFNHNVHSLRIVRELEHRYEGFNGLNLTLDTLEGIEKHETEYDEVGSYYFMPGVMPPLEAQVVSAADVTAFRAHDIEDAIVSNTLSPADFDAAGLMLWDNAFAPLRSIAEKRVQMAQLSRRLIDAMVGDVQAETVRRLEAAGIGTLRQVREFHGNLCGFSEAFSTHLTALGEFLYDKFYKNWHILRMTNKGRMIIRRLFEEYEQHPAILPPEISTDYLASQGSGRDARLVLADHLAGMTDRYAVQEYLRLFEVGHPV
jgi:dGTPase